MKVTESMIDAFFAAYRRAEKLKMCEALEGEAVRSGLEAALAIPKDAVMK